MGNFQENRVDVSPDKIKLPTVAINDCTVLFVDSNITTISINKEPYINEKIKDFPDIEEIEIIVTVRECYEFFLTEEEGIKFLQQFDKSCFINASQLIAFYDKF